MTATTYQPGLLAGAASLAPIPVPAANRMLVAWGHYLGACERPFGVEAWALEVAGQPVSIAVSASTTSTTAAGHDRQQLVELARLCSAPGAAWATRAMLRLWREVAAPAWSHWPVAAAVAYSQNDRHEGRIYRFDGWTRHTDRAGSGGGGTWSTSRTGGHAARGPKTLWSWRYPEPVGTIRAREKCPYCMTGLAAQCPWHQDAMASGSNPGRPS